jgi:hypothetical protein
MIKCWFAALSVIALLGLPGIVRGQAVPAASGHWEGSIEIPGQPLKVEIDLAPTADKAKWEGTITIPAQGLKGFPLAGIDVTADAVTFMMQNIPGGPRFTGTVAKDGKTLTGDFKQGDGTLPFSLTRTGDAKFERPAPSTPVTKEVEGSWEAALDINGTKLRLILKLANQPSGAASGTLISVDQNNAEVPIASVVQSGMHLTLTAPTIAGSFDGELKDGQLTGTWAQGPGKWPLTFTRSK